MTKIQTIHLRNVVFNLIVFVTFIFLFLLVWFSYSYQQKWRVFTITSGSMRPKIPMGSLILIKPQNSYVVGDVVTFRDGQRLVTHRIFAELPDSRFQTRGDANTAADRLAITKEQILGQMVISIPRLGRLLMLLQTKVGVVLLVVLPGATLIWKEINLLTKTLINPSNRASWSNWIKFFKYVSKTSNKK